MQSEFSQLGLAEPLLRAAEAAGYETATPIQAQAIPVVLGGRDLIGCAQTGTGKTAAFTLPMLDRLLQTRPPRAEAAPQPPDQRPPRRRESKGRSPKPRTIRALVLAPTRELAAQIGDSLARYGKFTPLRHAVIFGGVSQANQVRALRHGVDTLVATPGRLLDLMGQGYVDLAGVEILVLDEADQMLDMGFLPDLKRIVASVPRERQTLMFSATMPPAIRELANNWLHRPATVAVAPVATPAERIAQSVFHVDKQRKADFLAEFLKRTPHGRTLVFSRTKHGADKIVKRLLRSGFRAAAIHGNKSQGARTRVLAAFKSQQPPVLVATDIAARGLDIDDVTHVVNFDLPETPETYVHRIGRTARAGAEGVAVSLCSGDERGLLRQIERLINIAITIEPPVKGFEPTEVAVDEPPQKPRRKSGRPAGSRRAGGRRSGGQPSGERRLGEATAPATGSGRPRRRKRAGGGGKASATARPATASGGPTSAPAIKKPRKRRRQAL